MYIYIGLIGKKLELVDIWCNHSVVGPMIRQIPQIPRMESSGAVGMVRKPQRTAASTSSANLT